MSAKILILGESADLWQRFLEPYDYQVSIIISEQEAMARLTMERFDLLFLPSVLPSSRLGDEFLAELRSHPKSTGTLVLMREGKDGRSDIVRAPIFPNQANGYIVTPFSPEDLAKMIEKLLAGASTQPTPGDEGYTRCEYQGQGWSVIFEHPTFWEMQTWRKDLIQVFGPLHHSLQTSANITIYRHLTHDSTSPYIIQDVISNKCGESYEVHQVGQKREVQVSGLIGQEIEYLWQMIGYRDRSGKGVMAIVNQDAVYALSLEASEEDFDDYRAIYLHLLESIQFS